ncbi:MAG: hybrid sensor histidine kinase/response regulator [Clostridiales bacterium]
MKKNRIVLMVDDNPNNLKILAELVSEIGYIPALSLNGIEALDYLKEEVPDLILLDIMMPLMDGYEVCKKIRVNPKFDDIPIIFITAKSGKESEISAMEIGGIDFITKPFDSSIVKARIINHMELKISKEKYQDKVLELKELNSEKDKFISILAHDMKNPLFAMTGLLEMLVKKGSTFDSKKLQTYVEKIYNSSIKLQDLLESILKWANLRKGRYETNYQSINIFESIFNIIELYKISSLDKNINISCNIEKDLKIIFDQDMFNMIFRNLLNNSIKFTQNGGEIIFNGFKKNKNVILSIEDNGEGMDENTLNNIFTLNDNKVKYSPKKNKGSGLGLLIVKEILDFNDIDLNIESALGKGTKFIINFRE